MIDTKKILDHEVDFLLDSLDFYEKIKFIDNVEYSKIREMVESIENQVKRQIESGGREEENENASYILSGLNNYKQEVLQREKDALMSKKITKEKITLLKAKLILLQQEKAVESIFKNLN